MSKSERRRSKDLSPVFALDEPPSSQSKSKIKHQTISYNQTMPNPSDETNNRTDLEKQLGEYILRKIDDGPPVRYQLKSERVNLDKLIDKESRLRRFTLGKRNPSLPNRTILLVGATGSGKSTLVNALLNFVMGVKFEDKVWFEIIADEKNRSQSNSQTTAVCVYELFGLKVTTVPYSLTIIDTPGYGHTEGIEYDEITTKILIDLFCVPDGVETLDTVGLVLKATENRLDDRLAYILNSVTSLFGKDMEKKIVALMTHSDGGMPEDAIKALEDAKVKCAKNRNNEPIHFLFNNRQNKNAENSRALQFAFEISEEGLKNFTDFLGKCQPQTLKTTVEVMKERIRLTACIQNLEERVATIEVKQNNLKKNRERVIKHEKQMNDNKNFTFQSEETYKKREKIDHWWDNEAVSCLRCEETCHYPGCTWAWSPSVCVVMKDGRCTVCSGKCPAEDHVRQKWKYVTKTRTVPKTKEEMKAKYEQNKAKSEEKTTLLEEMKKEIENLQQTKNQCLDEAVDIIEQLERIALNINAVSTYVHLESLIKKMKENGDTEKVQKLEKMRDEMDDKNRAGAMYLMKSTSKWL